MPRFPRVRDQAGFTLIEVMVAALVTMIGFAAVATVFDMAKKTTVKTRARDAGTSLTRELVEAARAVTYHEITDATILARMGAADPTLADMEPGLPHTVERRGTVYTIEAQTCIMDDGRDGGGVAPRAGDFCSDSVAAGATDPVTGRTDRLPEDYKRVDVTVQWTLQGHAQTVRQTTLVNNPGSANAPAVLSLTGVGVPSPPVIGDSTTRIDFNLTTSSQPHAVRWMLDGAAQALICTNCTGKAFSFTWDLLSPTVAPDGPYLVSAEAYDANSVAGPSRSTTIVLNRSEPIAPRGFAGGRNGTVVELEWVPNSERDLTGYQVYREDATGWIPVASCPRSLKTTCVDTAPPDAETVRYKVHAYDVAMDGVTPRRSTAFSTADVIRDNRAPNPVPEVQLTDNGDGTFTLRWSRPSPDDPDEGDYIAFFRLYVDGTTVDDRWLTVSAGDALTFEHTFSDEAGRSYWVSAVDNHFAEAPPTAAVEATP